MGEETQTDMVRRRVEVYDDARISRKAQDDADLDDLATDDELEDDEETGLTKSERKKRTRRKHENAQLDGQIHPPPPNNEKEKAEKKLATAAFVRNLAINGILIGLWYGFSISISVYNKWMFSGDNLDFHFPLFTTSLHMLVQFSLAATVLFFFPRFRPGNDGSKIDKATYSQLSTNDETPSSAPPPPSTKPPQPLMTKWFYLSRIGPCGTATALDIGLGNFSLRFITLTFFTMCKSSVLAFVLLFAFLFRLEQPTWKLCLIIFFMTVGVIMMVAGETDFNALGFVLVMLASFCSGFRWSLTQILLLRNRATSNPFSTILFLTPVMFLALFLLALPIEGPLNVIQGIRELASAQGGAFSILLLLFPGFLAFLMVSAEFALIQRTSVVTLSVCGIFKEVLTISAAGVIFGDELSPVNVSGVVVTVAAIAAYNVLKYGKMKESAVEEAREVVKEVETREEGDKDVFVVEGEDDDEEGGRNSSGSSNTFVRSRDASIDDTGQGKAGNGVS